MLIKMPATSRKEGPRCAEQPLQTGTYRRDLAFPQTVDEAQAKRPEVEAPAEADATAVSVPSTRGT